MFSNRSHAVNAWVPKWVDGPATATYERTPTALRTYVNVPSAGGHVEYTLNSNPVKSWSVGGSPVSSPGTQSFGPASTATSPKISTNVKIPVLTGAAVGSAVSATLTMAIPKASLAKAGVALMRASPYVSAALTFGWLANAGYQYFKETDTFGQPLPTTTTQDSIPNIELGYPYYVTLHSNDAWCSYLQSHSYPTKGYDVVGQQCNIHNIGTTGCTYTCNTIPAPYSYSTNGCPTNYTLTGGQCVLNAGTPPITKTPAEIESGLASAPLSGTSDSAAKFDDQLSELIKNGYYPDPDTGTTPQLTGPSTPIQGEKSTTTTPTGDTVVKNTVYNNTYNNNYVETTETTTTTTTTASGTTTTQTTSGSPNLTATKDSLTDCDKYPQSVGCLSLGDIPTPDVLPKTDVSITVNPSSWGSGTCPAPKQLTLSNGTTKSWSYQPMCDFMGMAKPVILGIAWIAAGFIVLGSVREA
jgi:hypothetical protein